MEMNTGILLKDFKVDKITSYDEFIAAINKSINQGDCVGLTSNGSIEICVMGCGDKCIHSACDFTIDASLSDIISD